MFIEQFTYSINFDKLGASNLLKYSRNVFTFEMVIMIPQTKFERDQMKITTFVVFQQKKGKGQTDGRTEHFAACIPLPFTRNEGGGCNKDKAFPSEIIDLVSYIIYKYMF